MYINADRLCLFRLSFREKGFLHTSHVYIFCPEWDTKCRDRCSLRLKVLSQPSSEHLKGRRPACSLTCWVRCSFFLNSRLQVGHMRPEVVGASLPEWVAFCPSCCGEGRICCGGRAALTFCPEVSWFSGGLRTIFLCCAASGGGCAWLRAGTDTGIGCEAGVGDVVEGLLCAFGAVCIEIRLIVIFCLFSMGSLAGLDVGAGAGKEAGCLGTLVIVVFEESRCMAAWFADVAVGAPDAESPAVCCCFTCGCGFVWVINRLNSLVDVPLLPPEDGPTVVLLFGDGIGFCFGEGVLKVGASLLLVGVVGVGGILVTFRITNCELVVLVCGDLIICWEVTCAVFGSWVSGCCGARNWFCVTVVPWKALPGLPNVCGVSCRVAGIDVGVSCMIGWPSAVASWGWSFICTWYVVGNTRFLVSMCATICWSEFSSRMVIGRKHLFGDSRLVVDCGPARLESRAAAFSCVWAGTVPALVTPPLPGINCSCICGWLPPNCGIEVVNWGAVGEESTKFNFGFLLSPELDVSSWATEYCVVACSWLVSCCSCCWSWSCWICCHKGCSWSPSCGCNCNWVGFMVGVTVWDCRECCCWGLAGDMGSFFPSGVILMSGLRRINSSKALSG